MRSCGRWSSRVHVGFSSTDDNLRVHARRRAASHYRPSNPTRYRHSIFKGARSRRYMVLGIECAIDVTSDRTRSRKALPRPRQLLHEIPNRKMTTPCPFCGDEREPLIFTHGRTAPPVEHVYKANCRNCFSTGPESASPAGALTLWNNREAPGSSAVWREQHKLIT